MAARNTRSLVLDVSADVTKLASGSKVAKSAMLELQRGAESVEAAVRKSMSDLMPVESARAAEAELNRIFRSVKANAQAVLNEADPKASLQLFDVGAADEQVRVLTAQAGQLRVWSQAAEAASQEGGEFAARQQQIAVALAAEAQQLEAQAMALDETASAFRQINAASGVHETGMRRTTQMSGEARAGLQQLSFQLNDVAVQYAAGTPPMVIFAQQSGQVVQAIGMMTNGAKGLLGFLGGPWGMIIVSATMVLAPFVAKLWEAEEATAAAETGADALGQAQSVLGRIFDLTSGKIENQNELLRLNARLTAINLRADAEAKRNSSQATFESAGQTSRVFQAQLGSPEVRDAATAEARRAAELVAGVQQGSISRETALAQAEKIDFSQTRTDLTAFRQAIIDAAFAETADKAADYIDQSLDSGTLAAELRRDAPQSRQRPKKDTGPTQAEINSRFEDDQLGLAQQTLRARLQMATSAEERAELELRSLEWDRRQDQARIEADKHYSKEQKAELSDAVERRAEAERELIERRKRQQLEQEAEQLAGDQYQANAEVLRLQYDLAETQSQRRRIALQILEAEDAYLRSKLEAVRDSDTASEIEKQRAQIGLDELQRTASGRREQVLQSTRGPMESYRARLEDTVGSVEALNEAFEQVHADGLASLEDGLVGIISGTESVGSAFKKMTNQIIADLIRIQVQKLIINSIGGSGGLFSFLGFNGGGQVGAGPVNLLEATGYDTGGAVRGPGTGTSDSIPAWLSNGEFVVREAVVSRPGVLPFLKALNDGALPGFATGGLVAPSPVSLARLPSLDRLSRGGSSQDRMQVDVRARVEAGPMLDARIEEVSARTVSSAAEPIMAAAEARTRKSLERPRLPGGYA